MIADAEISEFSVGAPAAEGQSGFVETKQVVCFYLHTELYGVYIDYVQEIVRLRNISRIPGTPPYLTGVLNLRGRIIPIVDLQSRFDLEFREYDEYSRVIVMSINDAAVGIIVNSVTEVLKVPVNKIDIVPTMASDRTSANNTFLSGVAKANDNIIILLRPEEILDKSYFI